MSDTSSLSGWKSSSLYVGELSPEVTETDLLQTFTEFGTLESVKVCRNWDTGRPLGYGFINFAAHDSASRALKHCNFKPIKGQNVRLMYSTKRSTSNMKESQAANVFIKGLSKNVDDKLLYNTFNQYGTVLSCRVARNKKAASLGYGYVSFASKPGAQKAIDNLNEKFIWGTMISVEHFVDKKLRGDKPWTNVHISGVPAEWDKFTLKRRFSIYGTIKSAVIMAGKTGQGFGFVDFESHESAKLAVGDNTSLPKMHRAKGDTVFYVPLKVTQAQKKLEKPLQVPRAGKPSASVGAGFGSGIFEAPLQRGSLSYNYDKPLPSLDLEFEFNRPLVKRASTSSQSQWNDLEMPDLSMSPFELGMSKEFSFLDKL